MGIFGPSPEQTAAEMRDFWYGDKNLQRDDFGLITYRGVLCAGQVMDLQGGTLRVKIIALDQRKGITKIDDVERRHFQIQKKNGDESLEQFVSRMRTEHAMHDNRKRLARVCA